MAMDRRSTVRMNKERLKAALDSGFDEASGEAAKDGDGNWTTISEELGQIQEVADDLDTYDLNMNVGGKWRWRSRRESRTSTSQAKWKTLPYGQALATL